MSVLRVVWRLHFGVFAGWLGFGFCLVGLRGDMGVVSWLRFGWVVCCLICFEWFGCGVGLWDFCFCWVGDSGFGFEVGISCVLSCFVICDYFDIVVDCFGLFCGV